MSNVDHFLWNGKAAQLIPAEFGRPFPRGRYARQKFPGPEVSHPAETVRRQMSRPEVRERIKRGSRVAVGVGSRGIACLSEIVGATVECLQEMGARPFILPAMGSHGGAVAEGQRLLLEGYGVSESSLGVPVEPSMEVVQLGTSSTGVPVYVSRAAQEADAILPICRIKAHTSYRGPHESGILKMLAIGYGKHKGAATLHAQGFGRFKEMIPEVGNFIMERLHMPCAVAVVENARERPALIRAVLPSEIAEQEPELLAKAKEWMGRFLFDEFDVLIVDEFGKNISGDGMDPNVTGRYFQPTASGGPRIHRIVVLDLTPETHGNACGLGGADITTRSVLEKLDFGQTYTNAITSTVLPVARLPVVMPSAETAIALALGTMNQVSPPEARVIRVKNTLELEKIWISEALAEQSRGRQDIELLEEAPLF